MGYNLIIMKTKEISVFFDDSKYKLSELTGVLTKKGADIRAISYTSTTDISIVRLIANKCDEAFKSLLDAGFIARISEVAAVEVTDSTGGLAGIIELLENNGIVVDHFILPEHVKTAKYWLFSNWGTSRKGLKSSVKTVFPWRNICKNYGEKIENSDSLQRGSSLCENRRTCGYGLGPFPVSGKEGA